jgi:ABC-type antimicrobial peptide transport system permease subunit
LQTLDDAISHAVARPRLALMLLGWFAGIALLLAAVGIYATASFMVNERNREIGIRIAVGAEPVQIYRMLGMDAARVIAAGVALGTVAAMLFSGTILPFMYQTPSLDFVVYLIAAAVLSIACLAAAFGPAKRASRTDPILVLRQE